MALIELENITKYYGMGDTSFKALDDVSLTISRGDFVAITGTSGSGKSTLMNMLGLLDTQSTGTYRLDGTPVNTIPEHKLSHIRNREIGFIFQSFNLIPSLTAFENVELPLIYRGVGKEERRFLCEKSLERVGVLHRRSHKPSEMSGGQQQRVAIARAIAAAPSIILADEPTGNLDSKSGTEVMRILYELNEQGKTIIIITHDEKIAENSRRVIRISDGKLT
ncbi:MAG: ABC transporter ATP-binding protein [Ruminococcus sp.]|jgi:putative ABC transport system ATP-binding protein|nr:ABC transporter ATP-binding protein [Ruminococcus sp.]